MSSLFHRLLPGDEVEEQRPAPAQEPAEAPRPEAAAGLINAEELPSAADALAELFPEEPPAATAESEAAPTDEVVREEVHPAVQESQPLPKRRGILSWLFGSRDSSESADQSLAINEADAPEAAEPVAAAGAESRTDSESRAEVTAEPRGAAEPPISAEQLPPGADALAEIFPPDQTPAEPEAVTSAEIRLDTPAEVPADGAAELARDPTGQDGSGSAESAHANDPVSGEPVAAPLSLAQSEFLAAANDSPASAEENSSEPPQLAADDIHAAPERPAASPEPTEPRRASYRDWALDEKLASHREWIDSHGLTGQRADLSGAELEAADLISINLRLADLHDANLRAADLLLADLRDACLVRADLEEACLVGANLEGANLEGASLETAMGLVPRQLAGANLRDALLAPQLMEFEPEAKFSRNALQAHRYFGAMTAASLVSWLILWKTKDAQLVTDSAVLPFLHSRAAAAALPTAESYLIIPVVLFLLYLMFHFHLQRLWESVQELPAIFPDGHPLGEGQPSIILGLLRTHFRWMNPDPSSTRLVERGISLFMAYGVVPGTLLLFWARYLTRQEIHGTILQAALAVVASGIAIYAVTKVGRPPDRWDFERKWTRRLVAKVKAVNSVSAGIVFGMLLMLVSAGTIFGVPHDRARAPQYSAAQIRRWAPSLFWWLGYDPYADLTEASLSARPTSWSVEDDQISLVDGARLNDVHLRYAQAYGVFLANAHLLHADLQGAFLSQADLRGADLGQSNLRYAVLDQAHMYRANLDRSNLNGADLRRADLRAANLSHSSLEDAILEDARLDGASLYTARLDGATLNRANLEKADLRDADLAGAHMDHADLQGAYLWSAWLAGADLGGAQFTGAILIDANLRGANLGGAQFAGTVLNNTDLNGASLEGADLRGALGLTVAQMCSAKSRRGAMLNDALEMQVEAQCGGLH